MNAIRPSTLGMVVFATLAAGVAGSACSSSENAGDHPNGAGNPNGAGASKGTGARSGSSDDAGNSSGQNSGAGSAVTGSKGTGSTSGSGAGSGGTSGSSPSDPGSGVTGGPRFPGAGTGYASVPLVPGLGPETAGQCAAPPDLSQRVTVQDQGSTCFYGGGSTTPAATVEHILETINDKQMVHVRVTFDPAFVDNTYGVNSIGWNPRRPHTFDRDLTKSDHVEIMANDANGTKVLDFNVDYISADPTRPCGYGTLGVNGGDGSMVLGDASSILAASTSLDRNLNGCGYCLTKDSPKTDANYTPTAGEPNWDYRVVYEVWIDAAAFGAAGFGSAYVTFVHASPSKASSDTLTVESGPCPPKWEQPYCPPYLLKEGQACGGNPPGAGGASGAGGGTGAGGAGGSTGYGGAGGITSDGGACPPGWVPDIPSEGRYCVPA